MLSQPAESCASTSVSTGETSVDGGVESRGVAIKRRLDSPRQACTHVAHTANHVRDQGDENAAGGYLGPARWACAATALVIRRSSLPEPARPEMSQLRQNSLRIFSRLAVNVVSKA
jgi:hypothetical protein